MTGKEKDIGSKQLRSFGLIVGGIFAVIAFWPAVFHAEDARIWAVIVSGLLVIPALLLPTILRPIYKLWMRIGLALAWVNTRVILSIGFYGMFTPIGFAMRLFGKDPLHRRFDSDVTTYRVPRSPRPGSHMEKQF